MRRQKYIIAYDIVSNKRRRKIAQLLENHGTRMNRSVFECVLDRQALEELLAKLRQTMKRSEDSILLYHQCRACGHRALTLGVPPPDQPATPLVTVT
jgi:CRISPR-associated protein Cas2